MKQTSIILASLLVSGILLAQTGSISGTVMNKNGEPLAGANVTLEGTSMGAAADADGAYMIANVQIGTYTITAAFIGYSAAQQTVTVGVGSNTLNFDLNIDVVAAAAVSVIGSRFARSAEDQAVPVDVFTAQEIRRAGFTETGQILQALAPSFNMPKTSISDGSDAVRPMTLRGLSSGHVLVLVNGKRRHSTALVHVNSSPSRGDTGVDLNAIPSAAIQRIEVLRDGAAAQYGSDAIAGVINIVLKTDADGGHFSVYTGKNNHIAEKIPESANLYDWVGNGQRYEWNPTGYVDINDPDFVAGSEASITGSEDYLVTDGQQLQVQYSNSVALGDDGYLMIAAEARTKEASNRVGFQAGRLYEVNSDYWSDDVAETQRLQPGSDWYINPQRMIWGDQAKTNFGAMYNSELPIGDKRFYSFGGYTVRHADTGCYTRKPNQAAKTWLSSSPTGFVPHIQPTITDFSMSTGLEGIFGDWGYDVSSTYGSNDFHFNMLSTNASFGPEQLRRYDIGGFVFTQLTNNLDLTTQMGDIDLAIGAEMRTEEYRIYAGETASYANGQYGTNVAGWDSSYVDTAGVTQYVGLNSSAGGGGCQCFSGFRPSNAAATQNANRSSYAGYADAEMEVMPGMRVGGALRFENYSDFGSTVNFKGTVRYEVSNDIVLRAAGSSGFRAPALAQAYQSKVATNFMLDTDINSSTYGQTLAFEVGNFPVDNPFSQALGAKELTPEKAFNLSAGLNANFGGLRLSLDVYSITITDRIVMTGNFSAGDSELGQKIEQLLEASGVPGATSGRFFFNGVDTKTNGLDIVAAYSMDLAALGNLDLSFAYNTTVTEITEVRSPEGLKDVLNADATLFDNQERRTMESSQPKDNLHLTANYSKDNWYLKYHIWRVGESLSRGAYKKEHGTGENVSPLSDEAIADNGGNAGGTWTEWTRTYKNAAGEKVTDHEWVQVLGNKTLMDLEVGYDLGLVTLSAGANNLLDVMPEKGAQPGAGNGGSFVYGGLSPFGMSGRFVYTKLSFNF
ncbi:MAG: TonB-dependent receptor [Candidatus Marinimicrobia bacterium]|nr:TonB-dependent receptor [Candidatus Neomarinimicrobiota bacterium]